MSIKVVPYDPTWPASFDEIRSDLVDALRNVEVITIEHVGSTSVPGLAAKPVVDIDVVVAADQVEAAIRALELAGYTHRGEMGVPDRHAFVAPDGGPRRHIYVTIDGCLALRNHLGLRRVLRADAELRERYGRLKLALTQRRYDNVDQYVADKSELLQIILERAGISEDERRAIDEVNRPSQ